MHKDPVKRKERLYSLIGLIVGIGLLVGESLVLLPVGLTPMSMQIQTISKRSRP